MAKPLVSDALWELIEPLHELLLLKLNEAELIDWTRAAIDSSQMRAWAFGGCQDRPARPTAPGAAPSII
jgi:hypothetical protein